MARIRTIQPEFWEDEKIASLPIPCRLFYIGTWNLADDNGVIRGNPVILKSKIFPYDENLRVGEVQKWLDALVKARMLIPIIYDPNKDPKGSQGGSVESYYVIRTFHSHQKFDARYPNYLIDEKILKSLLKESDSDISETPTGTQRAPDVNPTGTRHGKGKGKGNGNGKENNTPPTPPRGESELSDFEKFKQWLIAHAPYCANPKNFTQMTENEFVKLKEKYTSQQIADMIEQIENRKDLRKRYSNLYRTVLNWLKRNDEKK
jgi:hypothetical protein